MAGVSDGNRQRGLSKRFMAALREPDGELHWVLSRVQRDQTLLLEIRGGYINVYYRGGNLLRIAETAGGFDVTFDDRYFAGSSALTLPPIEDAASWKDVLPRLKDAMDLWFGSNQKLEREHQQLVVRDNNFAGENATDYFICDIEYDNRDGARIDLLGVRWPSTPAARRSGRELRLAFIEMKHGDGAMKGKAGIAKHMHDILSFVTTEGALPALRSEMRTVFNQKRELGLISGCKKEIESLAEWPEVLLLLANHDPAKSALAAELLSANEQVEQLQALGITTRFVQASYCGYGIYDERAIAWAELVKELR